MKRSHKIITARQASACTEQPLTGLDAGMPVDSFCIALVYAKPLNEQLLISALRRALDQSPHYSGRLFGSGSTLPLIIPNNEGVLFTCNTFAGCIPDFDIHQPLKPHLSKLAHCIHGIGFDHHTPLVQIQLTNFSDGSILSISISHAHCDGTSMLEFIQRWASHTREEQPAASPSGWSRRDVQQLALGDGHDPSDLTPVVDMAQLPPFSQQAVETAIVRLPQTFLERLDEAAHTDDGTSRPEATLQNISRNDIIAAFLYLLMTRCRADPYEPCSLSIVCNIRAVLDLPTSYLGNAVILRHFCLDAEQLRQADMRDVAYQIRSLYNEITAHQLRQDLAYWQRRIADGTAGHFMPVATHLALSGGILLDNMSRFAFYELDFGAGIPVWIDTPAPSIPAFVTRGILMLPAPPSHAGIDVHVSLPAAEMTTLRTTLTEIIEGRSGPLGHPPKN